jgi:hypothetical protein
MPGMKCCTRATVIMCGLATDPSEFATGINIGTKGVEDCSTLLRTILFVLRDINISQWQRVGGYNAKDSYSINSISSYGV